MHDNQSSDQTLSYQHFDREHVPFSGQMPQLTAAEYSQITRRVRISGYGLFDTSDPSQRYFGRTLADLLNRAALEQYELTVCQPYHFVDGAGTNKTLRFYLWVMWYEKVDLDAAAARKFSETGVLDTEPVVEIVTDADVDDGLKNLGGSDHGSFAASGQSRRVQQDYPQSSSLWDRVRHRRSRSRWLEPSDEIANRAGD